MCPKGPVSWVIAGVLCSAVPLAAHHSPTEYDARKSMTLKGTLVKVEWVNPHAFFNVEVKDEQGKTTTWRLETSTPNALFRQGVTRASLPPGIPIVVTIHPARDGSTNGSGRELTFPDGRNLTLGGAGEK